MKPSLSTLGEVAKLYSSIYLIVSPPRCSSTAFARVFWEHPDAHFYSHEPFEEIYYQRMNLLSAIYNLQNPLHLEPITKKATNPAKKGLVVKDMPYQIGDYFLQFVEMVNKPIVFLIRDPRLNIASRIAKKRETGDSIDFPHTETGWQLIEEQIRLCRAFDIPHMIVDATDFRNQPELIFPRVFGRLGLTFFPEMLQWKAYPDLEIDNLGGDHSHLYRRVLDSTGIQPATEAIPDLSEFPTSHGLRSHVSFCLAIYKKLHSLPERVRLPHSSLSEEHQSGVTSAL
jgi:hypothetical protein